MLEAALVSALVALAVSAIAHSALSFTQRIRVRRIEDALVDLQERHTTEVKRRAAAASVESRASKAREFDAAIVAKHTGFDVNLENGAEHPDHGGMFDFFQRIRKPQ